MSRDMNVTEWWRERYHTAVAELAESRAEVARLTGLVARQATTLANIIPTRGPDDGEKITSDDYIKTKKLVASLRQWRRAWKHT